MRARARERERESIQEIPATHSVKKHSVENNRRSSHNGWTVVHNVGSDDDNIVVGPRNFEDCKPFCLEHQLFIIYILTSHHHGLVV